MEKEAYFPPPPWRCLTRPGSHETRIASLLGLFLLCLYLQVARVTSQTPPGCQGTMEVVFVVDGSESIGEHDPLSQPLFHWNKLQEFLSRVVFSLPVNNGDTRVGILTYALYPEAKLWIYDSQTTDSIYQMVMSLEPIGGATNTASAIGYTRQYMLNGARSEARRVVVLFTDGLSNWERHNVLTEALNLQTIVNDVHTVAITPYIDIDEMRAIASSPTKFLQVDLNWLDHSVDTLLHRLCNLPDPTPPTPAPPDCSLRADLVFLVDNSGSIRDKNPCDTCDNYNYVKEFLVSLVRLINVGRDYTRVAAIRFSSTAILEFDLDDYFELSEVEQAIWDMLYAGSYTNIAEAFYMAQEEVFQPDRGDRADVRNVVILVTDGESNKNESYTLYEADRAKASGITVFVVGMTNATNEEELRSIASDPVSQHYFESADVQSINLLEEELVRLVCSDDFRAKRDVSARSARYKRSGSSRLGFSSLVISILVGFTIVHNIWMNSS